MYKLVGEKEEYLQTATNNGSQISFTIPYTVAKDKDKTYTYILREQPGSAAGYVGGYSTEEYRITAKITDDGKGNLNVQKTVEKKNANGTYDPYTANNEVPSFTNKYTASGKVTLKGKKVLENHTLEKINLLLNCIRSRSTEQKIRVISWLIQRRMPQTVPSPLISSPLTRIR